MPHPEIINIIAGCCEIGFAILLIFAKTREFAACGIVFMLIFFTLVHIEMVRNTSYKLNGATVSPLLAWIRLVVVQPLLIWWAWIYTEIPSPNP